MSVKNNRVNLAVPFHKSRLPKTVINLTISRKIPED